MAKSISKKSADLVNPMISEYESGSIDSRDSRDSKENSSVWTKGSAVNNWAMVKFSTVGVDVW